GRLVALVADGGPAAPHGCVSGLQPDGLVGVGQGGVEVAEPGEDVGPAHEGIRVRGVGGEGGGERLPGGREVAPLQQLVAAVRVVGTGGGGHGRTLNSLPPGGGG